MKNSSLISPLRFLRKNPLPLSLVVRGLLNGFKRVTGSNRALVGQNQTLSFANHGVRDGFIGLANDFTVLQDDWIQVAPYGDYPHPGPLNKSGKPIFAKGVIQRLDNQAGEAMVAKFNSLSAKVGRLFGGRPWYVGHHDLDPIKYPDGKAYGWIMKLENRADGVYGQVKWTDDGEALKNKGAYKYFSPYWDGIDTKKTDALGRAIVMPNVLHSVAFTNQPNIPVMPLANEEQEISLANEVMAAGVLIDLATKRDVSFANDREFWLEAFEQDFEGAAISIGNAGTSEGAKKGWETRRAGMAAKDPAKASAKVTAKMKAAAKAKAAPKNGRKIVKGSPFGQGYDAKNPEAAASFEAARGKGQLEKDANGTTVWRKDEHTRTDTQHSGAYQIHDQGNRNFSVEKNGVRIGGSRTKEGAYKMAEDSHTEGTEAPLKISLPKSTGGQNAEHQPTEFQQGVRANLAKFAAQPHAAATAAAKSPGLFSKMFSAFKNPSAHSGDALGNSRTNP